MDRWRTTREKCLQKSFSISAVKNLPSLRKDRGWEQGMGTPDSEGQRSFAPFLLSSSTSLTNPNHPSTQGGGTAECRRRVLTSCCSG